MIKGQKRHRRVEPSRRPLRLTARDLEAFDYIANYFENSLEELGRRYPEIEGSFRRIDANHFTSVAYRNGKAVARCSLRLGGLSRSASGIEYSTNDAAPAGSFNEQLSVGEDEHTLFLQAMGLCSIVSGKHPGKLTMEGGAELLWSLFIEPLQRK